MKKTWAIGQGVWYETRYVAEDDLELNTSADAGVTVKVSEAEHAIIIFSQSKHICNGVRRACRTVLKRRVSEISGNPQKRRQRE